MPLFEQCPGLFSAAVLRVPLLDRTLLIQLASALHDRSPIFGDVAPIRREVDHAVREGHGVPASTRVIDVRLKRLPVLDLIHVDGSSLEFTATTQVNGIRKLPQLAKDPSPRLTVAGWKQKEPMNMPALVAVAFHNMSAQWSHSGCMAAEETADMPAVLPPERVRQCADCLIRGRHGEASGAAGAVQVVRDVKEPAALVVGRLSERLCDAQKVGRLNEAPTEDEVSRHLKFGGQAWPDALGRARA